MLRRDLAGLGLGLLAGLLAGSLTGCAGGTLASQYAQAKAYLDAGANALLAGGQDFLVSQPPPAADKAALVQRLMASLEDVQQTLDAAVTPADWKAAALEALALMQQLSPMVLPLLGPAAPLVPIAISVITAFIASLPAPPNAPAVPPAALTRKAAEFHHRSHK